MKRRRRTLDDLGRNDIPGAIEVFNTYTDDNTKPAPPGLVHMLLMLQDDATELYAALPPVPSSPLPER